MYDETYFDALTFAQRNSRADGIDYALTHLSDGTLVQLDGLLIPSDPSSAAQNIVSQAGFPCVTIPVSLDEWGACFLFSPEKSNLILTITLAGCPFGISLVNTAFSEAKLVRWGSAIDDALGHRRQPPRFFEFDASNIPINNAFSG